MMLDYLCIYYISIYITQNATLRITALYYYYYYLHLYHRIHNDSQLHKIMARVGPVDNSASSCLLRKVN